MKLLLETNENVVIQEETSDNGGKHYFLEGVFLQANKKNRNNRIYPMNVMEKEVSRYIKEYVEKHRALGELGHPTGDGATSINFDNVTHVIEKIWRDGDYFKARAKILDTPKGKIVQELIKNGCQLGVSSRALGSVSRKDGTDYVGEDFHIITAGDIVFEPSAQTAFPTGLYENLEWEFNEKTGEYVQKTELNEEKKVLSEEELTKLQKKEFSDLLKELLK